MSETQYARIITKASTGVPTIPPSADHSNGDWISTDIYEHELYLDDATGKIYTNIGGVITDLAPVTPDTNFANTDLTLTANRTHDLDSYLLKFDNGQFEVDGSTGMNIVPDGIVPCWLTIQSTDTKRPLLVNSTSSANAATFQANSGYAVVGSGNGTAVVYAAHSGSGRGVWGDSPTGDAIYGTSNGGNAVWGNGGIVAETYNIGSSRNTSAVLQANSTTQGFLSPRMTTAQRDAIATPATGLEIYNTTTNRKEWYNGTYWQGEAYSLNVQAAQFNPAASTTRFFGNLALQPNNTGASRKIYVRRSGVIRIAEIYSRSTTAGDADNWSLYVRLNDTTDYLIQTVGVSANERVWTNSNINIPVVTGDYVEIKMINPAWVTAPASTTFAGYLVIE